MPQVADENEQRAKDEARKAERLRYLSIAQTMAVKSLRIKNHTKKALVAQQAFLFNQAYQGNKYHPDIYSAMYYAKKL